jgi:hypothetical protein
LNKSRLHSKFAAFLYFILAPLLQNF